MKEIGANIVRFLLFSNVFIALCACSLVIADSHALGIETNIFLLVFVGAATLLSYNLHRLIDVQTAKPQQYGKVLEWSNTRKKGLYASLILAVIICLGLVFTFKYKVIFILSTIGIITILYSIPIQINNTTFRLRNWGMSKIFWVASIWTLATFVLVYAQAHHKIDLANSAVSLPILERFLFIFSITLPFEIRDIAFDKKENLRTFATVLGTQKTQILAATLLVLLAIFSFWNKQTVLALFYLSIIGLVFCANRNRSEYFYLGAVDGTILLYAFIIIYS